MMRIGEGAFDRDGVACRASCAGTSTTQEASGKNRRRFFGAGTATCRLLRGAYHGDEASCSDEQVVKVYRLRWQIEMFFKRCKSILKLSARLPMIPSW